MEKVFKNKPIRILQIGMHDQLGGIEVFLMNCYRNIDRNKFQFDFINGYEHLYFEKEIRKMGGKIYNVCDFKKNPIKYYFQIKKIIKEQNYKIVHVNMLSAANILPVIAASKNKNATVVVHSHNNDVPKNIIKKILDRLNKKILHKKSDIRFACSNSAGEWMFNSQDFSVIYNGIELNKFIFNKQIRDKIRKNFHVEDKIVLGHVGRFEEQKNHDFLIDVFYDVYQKNNNYVLLLIGTGSNESKIKEKVKQLGLENNVIFLGVVNNPESYYNAMDIFLLPSKFEGLGIVNIEAQTNGLPCIVSSVVPDEAVINNCVKIPLSVEQWSKQILSTKCGERKIDLNKLCNYDIKISSQKLCENYEKNIRG